MNYNTKIDVGDGFQSVAIAAVSATRVDRLAKPHGVKWTKLAEETGEMAVEDLIAQGIKDGERDEGVIGEAADAILCILDILATSHEGSRMTAVDLVVTLEGKLKEKLGKWLSQMAIDHNFISRDYPRGVQTEIDARAAIVADIDARAAALRAEEVAIAELRRPKHAYQDGAGKELLTLDLFKYITIQWYDLEHRHLVINLTEESDFNVLGFDSLDFVEVIMGIEDELRVEIPDEIETAFKRGPYTVGGFIAAVNEVSVRGL